MLFGLAAVLLGHPLKAFNMAGTEHPVCARGLGRRSALICSVQARLGSMRVQETNKDQGRAFGHCGIVAAASAVLADLEKGGILKVCCASCCAEEVLLLH